MSPDFKDLLSAFNARGVEYLVVGAYALAAHGRVRATGDLELDLQRPGLVFQIGVAPLRIDILTAIDSVDFDEAWANRLSARFVDQTVPVLSMEHLIRNKRAVGRAQDLADLEWLERAAKKPRG